MIADELNGSCWAVIRRDTGADGATVVADTIGELVVVDAFVGVGVRGTVGAGVLADGATVGIGVKKMQSSTLRGMRNRTYLSVAMRRPCVWSMRRDTILCLPLWVNASFVPSIPPRLEATGVALGDGLATTSAMIPRVAFGVQWVPFNVRLTTTARLEIAESSTLEGTTVKFTKLHQVLFGEAVAWTVGEDVTENVWDPCDRESEPVNVRLVVPGVLDVDSV